MGYYFDDSQSAYAFLGNNTKDVMRVVARRFMGQNPESGLTYRTYCNEGILRQGDYRYEVDFNEIFPDAKETECVWAWGKYWFHETAPYGMILAINCTGPITIWNNGEIIFKSDIFKERFSDQRTTIPVALKEGWNNFVFCFKKTKAGFGGVFGSWLGKHDNYFLSPTPERSGAEGLIFSNPVAASVEPKLELGMSEKETGLTWYPSIGWDKDKKKLGQCERIFGLAPNTYVLGWTKAFFSNSQNTEYTMHIKCKSPTRVYLNKKEVCYIEKPTSPLGTKVKFNAPFGKSDILVKCYSGDECGFELKIDDISFTNPCNLKGCDDSWLYIGAFANDYEPNLDKLLTMQFVEKSINGDTFWRVDRPNTFVRMYNENDIYGRWNYPLGVTLYGLLHTGIALDSDDMKNYVKSHVKQTCDTFDYAMWDKQSYTGATTIHNLLAGIDSLDDCGSFGSLMLEAGKYFDFEYIKDVADYVADYIANKQIRLEDGTFFRKNLMHHFHEDTLWADDLYMSVPYLVRYYQFSGDRKYIDDAARQFIGFKKLLYMPNEKIMSHVYDFKHNTATNVPWGRGNGWVAFSLSELLAVLPADHELRPELLKFFNTLCEGYLALQDKEGMWHQVITDHDSYPEASCTSMFAYAFSRGVRFGWLSGNKDDYVKAVFKAWDALVKNCVDTHGNVYGVCRGSEFSFIPDYYKYELTWRLNDTHGVGIILLAGVETDKLTEFLNGK